MKKLIAMFSLMVVLCCSIGATTIKASDLEGTPGSEAGTVYVKVLKDVAVKEEPFPWSKTMFTAHAGDTFRYKGHYLGHYIIDINDDKYCGFVSDKESYTTTIVVY